MDNKELLTLLFGFILGVKHAFEADHVIAVSTIVLEQKNPLKASLVGTFWGMGHTTTLFVIGILVLLLRVSIPERIGLFLEFLVGVMLVILGVQAILKGKEMLKNDKHIHNGITHTHPLLALKKGTSQRHYHHRSFLIGLIHGLAGSGALTILVLSTISDTLEGLYYILIFGIGSIAGMTIMSFVLGLPLSYSSRTFPVMEKYVRVIAGTLSILFGFYLMARIGFVDGLFSMLY